MTWSARTAPDQEWVTAASSADGRNLVAAADLNYGLGHIYTSTDSGATWIAAGAANTNWAAVASSADGNKLFAAVNGGGIYTLETTPSSRCGNRNLGRKSHSVLDHSIDTVRFAGRHGPTQSELG